MKILSDIDLSGNNLLNRANDPSGGGGGSYMMTIWAEENAGLANNGTEWAFGNGANTPITGGLAIYVPPGETCEIVAMSAATNNANGTPTIEAVINGTPQGANCNVSIPTARSAVNSSFSPVALVNGDRLNFRTQTAGTNSGPNTVCAWLRYTTV